MALVPAALAFAARGTLIHLRRAHHQPVVFMAAARPLTVDSVAARN